MAKRVDNDHTKGLARPFLILAHVRTGGTFLAHALSNHPQVFCDRGETLHHLSSWRRAGVPAEAIVRAIWNVDGYHAAGFRAIYRQAFHTQIWPLILQKRPLLIHLVRDNVARQGVSFGYQQLVRQGELPAHPVHSFESHRPQAVTVNPQKILYFALKVRREMELAKSRLADYPRERILQLSYEEITGNDNAVQVTAVAAGTITKFIGVDNDWPLHTGLVRDFDMPMAAWFTNWADIRHTLEKAGFRELDE